MLRSALSLLVLFAFALTAGAQEQLIGFSSSSSAAQEAMEDQYDALISAEDLDAWMKEFTSKAQHVGSPGAKENAEILRDLAESWGFDA